MHNPRKLFLFKVTQEFQRAFYAAAIVTENTTWVVWIHPQKRNQNVHGGVNIALVITITLAIKGKKANLVALSAKKSTKLGRRSKKRGKSSEWGGGESGAGSYSFDFFV